MPFSSFNFIILLPVMVLSFWALPPRFQKVWLLILSTIVYLAAGWKDLAILLATVSLNWCGPYLIGPAPWVTGSLIAVDLALLGWFKYRVFLSALIGRDGPMALIIPLGISFYVFQLIAYQVELRRKEVSGRQPYLDFLLYIFFFPHHQAGPIMRPHSFLICFTRPRTFFRSRMVTGLLIFLWGLFKKVWIADLVAPLVNSSYTRFHELNGTKGNLLLMGVLYGIQIYGDFSGYSDMAVGMGRMFGYKFDRNFHQPYLSRNPSEFWKRWHVTLTNWMRDFVYFPLWNWSSRHLGNRFKPRTIMLACSLILMLITGFWHGASWNFILWGGIHGLIFVAWRLLPSIENRPFRFISFLFFQAVIMLTWVVFREPDIDALAGALQRGSAWFGHDSLMALGWFSALILFSYFENWLESSFISLSRRAYQLPLPAFALIYGWALFFVLIGAGSATTFIYQRF